MSEEEEVQAPGGQFASGTDAGVVTAWRIVSRAYADEAFSGEGGRLYGGRWNSEGVRATYLAGSLALAALEQLVHLSRAELLAGQFMRFRVEILAEHVLELDPEALPEGWRGAPATTRALGDAWAEAQDSVALRVPSAVVPEEANYLVNPTHPQSAEALTVHGSELFVFDERLLK